MASMLANLGMVRMGDAQKSQSLTPATSVCDLKL